MPLSTNPSEPASTKPETSNPQPPPTQAHNTPAEPSTTGRPPRPHLTHPSAEEQGGGGNGNPLRLELWTYQLWSSFDRIRFFFVDRQFCDQAED